MRPANLLAIVDLLFLLSTLIFKILKKQKINKTIHLNWRLLHCRRHRFGFNYTELHLRGFKIIFHGSYVLKLKASNGVVIF